MLIIRFIHYFPYLYIFHKILEALLFFLFVLYVSYNSYIMKLHSVWYRNLLRYNKYKRIITLYTPNILLPYSNINPEIKY